MFFDYSTPQLAKKDPILGRLNTLFMLGTGYWLTRFFQGKALLWSLVLILSSQLFLIFSTDLHVEIVSCWLGLVAMLLLLEERLIWSGMTLGIAFLISPKAIWFFAAMNGALASYWLVIMRDRTTLKQIVLLNVAACLTVGSYIAFWAMFSSFSETWHNVFSTHFLQTNFAFFASFHQSAWSMLLRHGPLLYLLWPLTWISLFVIPQRKDNLKLRFFIMVYATLMLILVLSYPQAQLYNMVFMIPPLFLLFADFFSWFHRLFQGEEIICTLSPRFCFWFFSLYLIGMLNVLMSLKMPAVYDLSLLIPAAAWLMVSCFQRSAYTYEYDFNGLIKIAVIVPLVFTGVVYPLVSFMGAVTSAQGQHQQPVLQVSKPYPVKPILHKDHKHIKKKHNM